MRLDVPHHRTGYQFKFIPTQIHQIAFTNFILSMDRFDLSAATI